MPKYVLLFEPYADLADMLVLSMKELGFTVDVGKPAAGGDELNRGREYACVFINLDQNRNDLRSQGLILANKASQLGLPVVMIPDDTTAQEVIRAKGWLQIKKPFKLAALREVMERATWARNAMAGSA